MNCVSVGLGDGEGREYLEGEGYGGEDGRLLAGGAEGRTWTGDCFWVAWIR